MAQEQDDIAFIKRFDSESLRDATADGIKRLRGLPDDTIVRCAQAIDVFAMVEAVEKLASKRRGRNQKADVGTCCANCAVGHSCCRAYRS